MDASPEYYAQPKLSFNINGENKKFQDKNKFKQYVATNPALQKVLEGKSQPKKIQHSQHGLQ